MSDSLSTAVKQLVDALFYWLPANMPIEGIMNDPKAEKRHKKRWSEAHEALRSAPSVLERMMEMEARAQADDMLKLKVAIRKLEYCAPGELGYFLAVVFREMLPYLERQPSPPIADPTPEEIEAVAHAIAGVLAARGIGLSDDTPLARAALTAFINLRKKNIV